jgi:hypothetical protein
MVTAQKAIFWTDVMNEFEGVDYTILLNDQREKTAKKRLGDARNRVDDKVQKKITYKTRSYC